MFVEMMKKEVIASKEENYALPGYLLRRRLSSAHFYSLITTPTMICLFLLVLVCSIGITNAKVHECAVQSYNETIHLRDCPNNPVQIEATRCLGQCYSEDYLIYDWREERTHYRHQHQLKCCTPNMTISQDIQVTCKNQQQQIITYPVVMRCECKLCTGACH
jgi:hypothetical protein